jgi:hypothetical protein
VMQRLQRAAAAGLIWYYVTIGHRPGIFKR